MTLASGAIVDDCVGVCGNVCCVAAVVKDSVFILGVLKYVVRGVMNVVFSVCIVTRGAVGARVHPGDSSQCCLLHNLQFVNAGQGCNRRPYGRGILQSRSHDSLIGSHECLLLFTPPCCCECFYHL